VPCRRLCTLARADFDKTHDISGRAAAAARAAASKAVEIEAKYDLTNKAKASAANVMASARELEEKHQVTTKVGNALGKGLDRLSAFLGACGCVRACVCVRMLTPLRVQIRSRLAAEQLRRRAWRRPRRCRPCRGDLRPGSSNASGRAGGIALASARTRTYTRLLHPRSAHARVALEQSVTQRHPRSVSMPHASAAP
jgi:hypothetical protein